MAPTLPDPPASFTARKSKILQQLAIPDAEYTDLSPKGSVDIGIRQLIDELNALDGLVTTSSCAGRVSVFLEGRKDAPSAGAEAADDEMRTQAGVGGKGGGGKWLFVSHDPVDVSQSEASFDVLQLLGLETTENDQEVSDLTSVRLIHFKFEPMILHVLTASPAHAQLVLKCALTSGYRESGALNITSTNSETPTPMVGVRTMGLTFESLIGYENPKSGRRVAVVTPVMLTNLLAIGNQRFIENTKRIERFRHALREAMTTLPSTRIGESGEEWEDAAVRKERKRAEGLQRKAEMAAARNQAKPDGQSSWEQDDISSSLISPDVA